MPLSISTYLYLKRAAGVFGSIVVSRLNAFKLLLLSFDG